MNKVLAVLGATAIGKTDLALSLAKKFNGELVSCDSRQVYKGLDIGTGKEPGRKSRRRRGPPEVAKSKTQNSSLKIKKKKGYWEINSIKIWMYDVANPRTRYTVKDYVTQSTKIVNDILKRGRLPIIVGGTGLYLKALLEGLPNLLIPVDPKFRVELEKLGLLQLQQELQHLDSQRWEELNNSERSNSRRLQRHLELIHMYGHVKVDQESKVESQKWKVLKIGLTAPRSVLYSHADQRCLLWLDQGIIEEVESLSNKGIKETRWREIGLNYYLVYCFIEHKVSYQDLVVRMQTEVRRYIKRQLTWFKKEKDVRWFDVTEVDWRGRVESLVRSWYDAPI